MLTIISFKSEVVAHLMMSDDYRRCQHCTNCHAVMVMHHIIIIKSVREFLRKYPSGLLLNSE